jgi:hypothetical protein
MQTAAPGEPGVLLRDTAGRIPEFEQIGGRPPILEVAVPIEFRAFIVESMSHFMADG